VGAVGELDRLLELAERGTSGGVAALAGRQHEPQSVLLGGEHDEGAAVELARGLGGVDEFIRNSG
jgi:hypothetical protein